MARGLSVTTSKVVTESPPGVKTRCGECGETRYVWRKRTLRLRYGNTVRFKMWQKREVEIQHHMI